MGFTFLKKLPTPAEIRNQYPIDAAIQELKAKRDQEIRDVFTGKSDKFLAIIGPCSADNEDAVCDYLLRLRKVQDKIADKVLIIPRVYTNIALTSVLNGLGKTGTTLIHSVLGILLRISFVIFAIPVLGIRGYLYGLLLSEILLSLLHIYALYHMEF